MKENKFPLLFTKVTELKEYKKNMPGNFKKALSFAWLGFTMAEAVLVMTILGIIATIMITTLKPAEFKERGLKVLADKIMAEIDTATTQILLNDSRDGTFENLTAIDGTNFGVGNTVGGTNEKTKADQLGGLYKKYLATTRKECSDETCSCYKEASSNVCRNKCTFFYLKDGACVGIRTATSYRANNAGFIFPGEDYDSVKDANITFSGYITFDINGSAEPNVIGKDIFTFPLYKYGINYNPESIEEEGGGGE